MKSRNALPSRKGLPYVCINVAMTADGKIATANRAVSSFGSRADQRYMLELRATADAVMAGARTVDLNAVHLGPGSAKYRRLRLKRGLAEYNLRVVVTGSGMVNPDSKVFRRTFSPVIVLTTSRTSASRLARLRRLSAEVKICGRRTLDFGRALRWLRSRWKVKRVLCEGGGELNDALFRAGLVNELHVTVCPRIFGGRHAPTLSDGLGAGSLAQATALVLRSAKKIGNEMFLTYKVTR